MASHRTANFEDRPYSDPNPLPSSVPHVDELGVTSAPLKSSAFAIGQYCKDVNGTFLTARSGRLPAAGLTDAVVRSGYGFYRGLYALQAGEPRSSSLSERGKEGH